ncbi:MAG TPA: nucleoside triphosphate pyrophosphohydrolase [Marinilabiliales bacterium]|jgi:XTP/dITP diphosphohydrolase|nr:MAG: nucleoside triphosphate pyrophosphohydrolase [Bacteroidetes bacterium GWA2_40_14]OFX58209.1 MAG: nucleoside triphosphate pyrophosphohydrolase [Bacteroidetes bacterium GWC2_40_13]OFX71367.1 MAG: nucleoside triphosphate pyrophosphohydrolase [Bacteroidetes bacterium GWD2_40_43]OFX91438.1 MAG: nucleoside triphosphate pyrophosphohydrolase [Bacteroidetes bacterium GWE2_40_63]OFY19507.1 MAG: nucleoside triphosphate pyrophosphohydrolase [Bacteroidetes bacterium GWF2_40_13]OFZ32228.1 MAG: nucle
MQKHKEAFGQLLEIMDELRAKCPWDKEQTLESLRTLTIEETYELADAIMENNLPEIKKELGDLLLHIVFYAKIGAEKGAFDISDVIHNLNEKLIYRHPHIFGDVQVADAREVSDNWEQLKLKEKGRKKSVLEGVPQSLPAVIKAHRIQDKVRGVGFDWDEKEQVWDKVAEEMNELKEELLKNPSSLEAEQEFGDLFFSLINAARLYGINPENALERTNLKFIRRFNYLEKKTLKQGIDLKNMPLVEMEKIWQEAKKYD